MKCRRPAAAAAGFTEARRPREIRKTQCSMHIYQFTREKSNLPSLRRMRHVPLTVGRRKGRVPIASQGIFLWVPHNGAASGLQIFD